MRRTELLVTTALSNFQTGRLPKWIVGDIYLVPPGILKKEYPV